MIIYKILDNGYYGGELDYPDSDGIPFGTTRTVPPEIPEDYYCKWAGNGWELTLDPPRPLQVQYVEPPRPDIQIVSMRQARRILFEHGHLEHINNYIQTLPSPEKELAQIDWEYATEVRKTSYLVHQIANVLNLDQEAMDQLFYEASLIGD
jgi:hypothetical protein